MTVNGTLMPCIVNCSMCLLCFSRAYDRSRISASSHNRSSHHRPSYNVRRNPDDYRRRTGGATHAWQTRAKQHQERQYAPNPFSSGGPYNRPPDPIDTTPGMRTTNNSPQQQRQEKTFRDVESSIEYSSTARALQIIGLLIIASMFIGANQSVR
jgi:hypothetical protein